MNDYDEAVAKQQRADKFLRQLQAVGDDADSIAAFLTGQGIKGDRHSAVGCPMACYLARLGFQTYITPMEAYTAPLSEDDGAWVRVPPPVADFILAFDSGEYPELVA